MTPSIPSRRALVTGAAAGIGLAIAKTLADKGWHVVGADRQPETVRRLREEAEKLRSGVQGWAGALTGVVCDLTLESDIARALDEACGSDGELDLLVSNAGVFPLGTPIEKMADADWDRALAVNLTAAMRVMRQSIPRLKKGRDAQIVVIGSRNVAAPGPGAAAYSASKAALVQLARVAALELASDGIRVNVIHPDAVFDTELWTPETLKRSADRYGLTVDEYQTRNLMKTRILAADVAATVLALTGAGFLKTTGAQIPVDGGHDRVI